MTRQRMATDVLVLGGGVIGLTSALALLRAGRSVTVLERGSIGCGASHGNCGTITPSHATPLAMPGAIRQALGWMLQKDAPFYVKPRLDLELLGWLLRFARRCNWRDFAAVTTIKGAFLTASRDELARLVRDEKLDCEFTRSGTLYAFRDAQAMEHMMWLPRALGEVGIPVQVLDGGATRAREPAFNDSIVGGFLNNGDAHLRPDRYVAELARAVRGAGGEIVESAPVQDFEREDGEIQRVLTAQASYSARDIVFALGAWSPQIARLLDLKLPVQPGKGYSITFERPTICPSMPVVLKERSVCVTAWKDGYRLGSTMEFSGYDSSLNRARLDALKRGAAEYLQEPVGPRVLEEWQGWRPMTWDDLPIIGRAPTIRNLLLATGHGMLGVTMSALTGKLVAEIVCGRPPSVDVAPYSASRF